MEEEKIIDQSQLAENVSEKIQYEFRRMFLVKPLEPVKVKKEFSKPVATDNKAKADKNGVEAIDYDSVETEVKEVDSDFRKGVVLKIPYEYTRQMNDEKWQEMPINVGDIIIYPNNSAKWFDLFKDTQMVSSYDIIGIEKTKE